MSYIALHMPSCSNTFISLYVLEHVPPVTDVEQVPLVTEMKVGTCFKVVLKHLRRCDTYKGVFAILYRCASYTTARVAGATLKARANYACCAVVSNSTTAAESDADEETPDDAQDEEASTNCDAHLKHHVP